MNIVIPMAGAGLRFLVDEYTLPKPLLPVLDKPMIQTVIENLDIDANYIFIIQEKHANEFELDSLLYNLVPTCIIVKINTITDGPARTALCTEHLINDDPLIITNCDQIIRDFSIDHLLEFSIQHEADGILGSFISTSNKNSYMKLNLIGEVTEVREKNVISNIATNGLHFWKTGKDFLYSTKKMILNNDTYNDEFYIAPTYNYLIADGKKILPFFYNLHFPIGTPEDLKKYNQLYG